MPGDDGLEATVQQCTRFEHSPSLIHQPRVSILGDDSRLVVEADPSRSHDIGVDVVKQIIDPEVFHMQIETFVELLANQPEILGEEQDPLARSQGNLCRGPLIGQGHTTSFD